MDKIEYQIDDKVYTQDFLTISDTIQVSKIVQKIKFKNMDVYTILEKIEKSGMMEKLFNIILKGPEPLKLDQIKPVIAIKVIKDFFYLNDVSEIIGVIASLTEEINLGMESLTFLTGTIQKD